MGASFSSNLTDAACAVHQFKINGYSATRAMTRTDSLPSRRLPIGGYDWEVHYTPALVADSNYWVAFKLVLLGAPRRSDVKAALRCRLVKSDQQQHPQQRHTSTDANTVVEAQMSRAFKRADESSAWVPLCRRSALEASGAINDDDSFTVECTITVITQPPDAVTKTANVPPSCSSGLLQSRLNHHLGELLRRGTGSDVTLVVAGECFPAHKAILASRSPVFMAQFFGHMMEKHSQRVEIKDMNAAVFRAMLGFIYTDMVPELDHQQQDAIIMAQHLLAAADKYDLDGLKSMCEDKLSNGATMETVATTLALAEQHGCSRLKSSCIELIAANLDAVMATEGYRHLMASSPLVMNDLLRAVRGRKN